MIAPHDITTVADGPEWLTLTMEMPSIAPDALLRWFVEPGRLTRWWGQKATVEPSPGGTWEARWPAMGWTLRGRIADLTATSLVVSWAWDHEPDLPARALIVRAEPGEHGARLRLIHGPYRPGEAFSREDDDRDGHREGWLHFLPALRAAIDQEATVHV